MTFMLVKSLMSSTNEQGWNTPAGSGSSCWIRFWIRKSGLTKRPWKSPTVWMETHLPTGRAWQLARVKHGQSGNLLIPGILEMTRCGDVGIWPWSSVVWQLINLICTGYNQEIYGVKKFPMPAHVSKGHCPKPGITRVCLRSSSAINPGITIAKSRDTS